MTTYNMTKQQAQTHIDSNADIRSYIRARGGMRGSTCPIVVVGGSHGPRFAGSTGYHTTPSGKTIVRHPRAYKWRTVYHASTARIEVSLAWLRRARPRTFVQLPEAWGGVSA